MRADFVITVEHAAPAERVVDFLWDDGTAREIGGTPVLTVYSAPSDQSDPLYTLRGTVDTPARAVFAIAAAGTTFPNSEYYATLDITNGDGVIQADGRWHGKYRICGR